MVVAVGDHDHWSLSSAWSSVVVVVSHVIVALPFVSAAPSMAEGTATVEPGEAEKALMADATPKQAKRVRIKVGRRCQSRVRRLSTLPNGVPCSSRPIIDFFTERVLHGRL